VAVGSIVGSSVAVGFTVGAGSKVAVGGMGMAVNSGAVTAVASVIDCAGVGGITSALQAPSSIVNNNRTTTTKNGDGNLACVTPKRIPANKF
jgi:hypothetical protein